MMARDNEAASRAEAIRAERQGRDSASLSNTRMRLQVREDTLDRENWNYRWANDVGNRVHHLKSVGYEPVQDRAQSTKGDGVGMGAEVAQLVDTTDHGAPVKALLMRIPKPIFDEDQRAKQSEIDQKEAAHINPQGGEVTAKDTRLSRSASSKG